MQKAGISAAVALALYAPAAAGAAANVANTWL